MSTPCTIWCRCGCPTPPPTARRPILPCVSASRVEGRSYPHRVRTFARRHHPHPRGGGGARHQSLPVDRYRRTGEGRAAGADRTRGRRAAGRGNARVLPVSSARSEPKKNLAPPARSASGERVAASAGDRRRTRLGERTRCEAAQSNSADSRSEKSGSSGSDICRARRWRR